VKVLTKKIIAATGLGIAIFAPTRGLTEARHIEQQGYNTKEERLEETKITRRTR